METDPKDFTLPVCMIDDGGGQMHFEAASPPFLTQAGATVLAVYDVPLDGELARAYEALAGIDDLLPRGVLEHLLSQAFATGFQAGQVAALKK